MTFDITFIEINIFLCGKANREGDMKKYAIYCLALLLLIAGQARARTLITPFGRPGTAEFDSQTGKTYTYHRLVIGQSLGFAVEGPVEVDVHSRAGLPGKNVQAEYQIQVWEDEYLVGADKFRSKAIDAILHKSNLLPAAYRTLIFAAPAGVHNYRLWLVSENIDTVFVRIYKAEPAAGAPAEKDMHLLQYKRLVHLYSKKNQTPYYLIDSQEGADLKVTGPMELIIRCRANFTTAMDGRIGYTISVFENGKEVNTLSATTSKSLTMAYQDYTGVVPSKPAQFIMKVPEGNHTYKFLLKESAAETVSLRFSMPK